MSGQRQLTLENYWTSNTSEDRIELVERAFKELKRLQTLEVESIVSESLPDINKKKAEAYDRLFDEYYEVMELCKRLREVSSKALNGEVVREYDHLQAECDRLLK